MIDTKKIKEIVKEIIEEEIKKERGLIREHIQLELHMLTEGDWFNEYVTKIIKEQEWLKLIVVINAKL